VTGNYFTIFSYEISSLYLEYESKALNIRSFEYFQVKIVLFQSVHVGAAKNFRK
jgi:hypothetical protein